MGFGNLSYKVQKLYLQDACQQHIQHDKLELINKFKLYPFLKLLKPMNGENRPLVTDEPVESKNQLVEVHDFKK